MGVCPDNGIGCEITIVLAHGEVVDVLDRTDAAVQYVEQQVRALRPDHEYDDDKWQGNTYHVKASGNRPELRYTLVEKTVRTI